MSYGANWGSNGGGALSDSQIERVRKYIRWDVPLTAQFQGEVKVGAQHAGRRPQLGSWNTRDSTRLLDFDGDGKHDVGWWIRPQSAGTPGTVKVLLSTKGFSTASGQHINTGFGWLGDSPVPQRIDGDARTDIVFYQPGGGLNRNDPAHLQGWWRRCITAATPVNTNCSSPPSPVQWGERGDVPLPGLDFDGSVATPEVAVYRPATAQFFWNYWLLLCCSRPPARRRARPSPPSPAVAAPAPAAARAPAAAPLAAAASLRARRAPRARRARRWCW